jgi:hypothetical protein
MYRHGASLLQFTKRPNDAISPSTLKLGLADRIAFAKKGGAIASIATKLARSSLNTPWTTAKGVNKAFAQGARNAASTLTRGGSEIAKGLGNAAKKFKFW